MEALEQQQTGACHERTRWRASCFPAESIPAGCFILSFNTGNNSSTVPRSPSISRCSFFRYRTYAPSFRLSMTLSGGNSILPSGTRLIPILTMSGGFNPLSDCFSIRISPFHWGCKPQIALSACSCRPRSPMRAMISPGARKAHTLTRESVVKN